MPHADPVVRSEWQRAYRERNKSHLAELGVAYRVANAGTLAASKKAEYERNKEAYKRRAKESRERNRAALKAKRSTPEFRNRRNAARRAAYVAKPKATPKTREQILADKKADYALNREHYRAVQKAYYQSNKPKWKELDARKQYWQRKFHHGLSKAYSKGSTVIDLPAVRAFYRSVFTQTAAVCEYCRGLFPIREIIIEHKQPFVLGGCHVVYNFAISCNPCNLRKGITPYDKWIALIGKEEPLLQS